ncbi:FRG domain-containing protein [Methylobacterium sp. E-066]|uniref:FRG domain-containing protein n=1 Tax=Methylobacterium sp. E-066 TaxID=2836584 RepID=UPI001FB9ECFC|nr:FRG domain-containing protein [Methylobacterium sp. E-066]MCJ2142307.1 FRG domain-containing protein [Methylobacterium sp. E-066]
MNAGSICICAPYDITAMSLLINKPKIKPPPRIGELIDLFKVLAASKPGEDETAVYRGHIEPVNLLKPSIFRKNEYRKDERSILRELIAIQPNEFRDDKSSFEQLVRMQHYGMPTRLLDFTYNPLVGLYFAAQDDTKDGEFLQLTTTKKDIKYFDSDTVSCISNLSNLQGRERDKIRKMTSDNILKSSTEGLRLLHFIAAEKPYFQSKIILDDLSKIVAVRPKQTNRRIIAQQGGFFLFGLKTSLADDNDFGIRIKRVPVPARNKHAIRRELDQININGSTLFPEIESAAKYILSKIPMADDAVLDFS